MGNDGILDSMKFIDGWRRHFTFYCDWTSRINEFGRLPYVDQICIAKRRLVALGWVSWATCICKCFKIFSGHMLISRIDCLLDERDALWPTVTSIRTKPIVATKKSIR